MNSRQRRIYRRKHGIVRRNIVFSSCGNDSLALLQWIIDNCPKDENVMIYSDTGWAAPFWEDRVQEVKTYAEKNNIRFVRTESEGMENLVRRKKGWPMPASNMQFCTDALKVIPAKKWMRKNDDQEFLAHAKTRCFTGIRKEESKNRDPTPRVLKNSERHDGRDLICPLVDFKEKDRDELINKTGLKVLGHSSMECFPCVCANKKDLCMLAMFPEKVNEIANIENEMGYTKNNKPRVMFRPYRMKNKHSPYGAVGILEAIKWGTSKRGEYKSSNNLFGYPNTEEYKNITKVDKAIVITDIINYVNKLESEGKLFSDEPEQLSCNSGFCGF